MVKGPKHTRKLEVIEQHPDSLLEYANNAREHPKSQEKKLLASVKEFGFTNPILVDENNMVLAGHGRLRIARHLGMVSVPTIVLAKMTEAQKRAYILADNAIATKGAWSKETLRSELRGLVDMGYDVELTGFDTLEIDTLISMGDDDEEGPKEDLIELPAGREPPVSRLGDLWHIGWHKVFVGDARALESYERLFGDERAELIVANPAARIIAVSYDKEFAEKQARDMLKVMDHPLYRLAFPGVRLTRRKADEIVTSRGGGRFSTSLGGPLTGRGGDFIVVDDPTKSAAASSEAVRDSDRAWLLNTLMTRLNNPETGAIVVVMQRLHEGDLVGVLKEQGGWHELCLPAIATEDARIAIAPDKYYQRRAGHALHPARLSLAGLVRQKQMMGSSNFETQFQGNPLPAHGNIIKAVWLEYYNPATLDRSRGQIVQSWDTASKENPHNDYSVCITALVVGKMVYVLDVFRRRVTFPKLLSHATRLAREHRARVLLIEDQSSGTQLLQSLRSLSPTGVPDPIRRRPEGDKKARVAGISAMIEAGGLHLPAEAPWLAELKAEVLGFPSAKFDDQIDALSQLMIWVRDRNQGADDDMVHAPIYGHKLVAGTSERGWPR